ncbi:MAG: hypothetical protein VXV96_17565 [Bdellovibrionota bacterium]|jgi:hypothetical protein|nr:hypothetical protein [Bdellovibrionota bacterium]
MKTKNFLTLLMAGLLSLGLASCGSDNEGGSTLTGVDPITGNNPVGGGVTSCSAASNYQDFKNRVSNGQFIQESSSYETYFFIHQEPEIKNRDWWIFSSTTVRWNYIGDFTRTSTKDSDTVTHEAGSTKTAVRDYLMSILNSATNGRDRNMYDGIVGNDSYIEVLTSSGMIYGIDLCKPIGANPIFEMDSDSGERYYYTGTSSNSLYNNNGFQPL